MDKTDRLLRAVIDTDKCSDKEVVALHDDPNISDDYDTLITLVGAMRQNPNVDADLEWQEVVAKADMKRRANLKKSLVRKVAAVAASTVAIACVAGGIAVGISMHEPEKREVLQSQPTLNEFVKDSTHMAMKTSGENQTADIDNIVTFREETLETIAKAIAEHYGVETVFKNPDAKGIRLYFRWEKGMTAQEVAQTLDNFEQISVSLSDNKLTIR